MSLEYNWFRQVRCQWNGLCTGMLESVLLFLAGYACHRNCCCYHLHYHHFLIQVYYWVYISWKLWERKNFSQSVQLVKNKIKTFLLDHVFSHPSLLSVIKCQLQKWYEHFFLQVKWMCYTHLHLHLDHLNPHWQNYHYPFHCLTGWQSLKSPSLLFQRKFSFFFSLFTTNLLFIFT